MTTAIIDYSSGNLHSAEKSFQRMAAETGRGGPIVVTADPEVVRRADRIVLPGVGAFADCRAGLAAIPGLFEAIETRAIRDGAPFLGICVGEQLMASVGREHGRDTPGFGWIPGEVVRIAPADPALKIPHMGWNALELLAPHPLLAGIASGDHAYFVHSYHLVPEDAGHRLATVDHGGPVTASVGRDNLVGTQFHPEKSQATGLRLIANFLAWRP
jgi:glutamine amidotransferase